MPGQCAACGHVFPEEEPRVPCPICGETARKVSRHAQDTAETREGYKLKVKREGYTGGPVFEEKYKEKTSGKTGFPTKEYQAIDRSDPDETRWIHKVDEQQPDGTWKREHDENIPYKAKRRPGGK
jgi:predicted  nucleic acid-binding Zn-ribbon protein